MKGVRTRYKNRLENENQNGSMLLKQDLEETELSETLSKINVCIQVLRTYTEKSKFSVKNTLVQ